MAAYDYLDQVIVATALIQPHDDDSFYNPGPPNAHYGYAFDGNWYIAGLKQNSHPQASWFTESPSAYRGDGSGFPTAGLILLSPVALTILDQSTPTLDAHQLPLWIQFLLGDMYALANNFDGALNGWTPSGLAYADGVISVIYTPDSGNQVGGSPPSADSTMVVTIDFSQDAIYLDVAI
jgi:hypothetical protein